MSNENPITEENIETIQPGKETRVILTDDLKKQWICLGCNHSFLRHQDIVRHMHSENHLVIVNSDFTPVNEIPQAEIRNMLSAFIA